MQFNAINRTGCAVLAVCGLIAMFAYPSDSAAQPINGDNQWIAPHGVATLVGNVGEECLQANLIGALMPE